MKYSKMCQPVNYILQQFTLIAAQLQRLLTSIEMKRSLFHKTLFLHLKA